ncbi:Protein phosphatase 1A [Trichoplax sp. H2]|nr:Protein phosphatase 1A [Trichoplax sp. H2]|eukprot:RDD37827.1 Protein phosphatase 1A [Trichoplax sp. H2]
MGAFLDKARVEKTTSSGFGNGLHYGLSAMQGWRVGMEDAHTAIVSLPQNREISFWGVFDGHAGSATSAYCAKNLLDNVLANVDHHSSSTTADSQDNVSTTSDTEQNNANYNESERIDKSGTTAVVVVVTPTHIIFGNCGDSRGILCRSNEVNFATEDHKPFKPRERQRIERAGGSVVLQRVNGSLAVSRALGDFEYKCNSELSQLDQLVSPEPDVMSIARDPKDEFIVLACDGIWDVMNNTDVANFVRSRLAITNDLEEICNEVLNTCLAKGSKDNMSIILITFDGAITVDENAKLMEQELDRKIVKEVTDIHNRLGSNCNLYQVMTELSQDDSLRLPPGGGIECKQLLVEKTLSQLTGKEEL